MTIRINNINLINSDHINNFDLRSDIENANFVGSTIEFSGLSIKLVDNDIVEYTYESKEEYKQDKQLLSSVLIK